jgi:glycerol uptake facilitator-like aquaporin
LIALIYFAGYGDDFRHALEIKTENLWKSMLLETIGSFILVFMYLCSTEEKTKFTKDSVLQTMILSSSYLAAMLLAGSKVEGLRVSPLNPAIGVVYNILYKSTAQGWASIWVFGGLGFLGSFLALIFFKFIYQKTQETLEEMESQEEDHANNALME